MPTDVSDTPGGADHALLEAILSSTNEVVYALDREWRFVLFNLAAENYFGAERDSVLGRTMWELFPQGRGTPFEQALKAAMDDGVRSTIATQSAYVPGRDVELRIAPMQHGITVVIADVTERLAAERALIATADHYRFTVELNPQVVWTALPDGQLDRVSERWQTWTGDDGLGDSWGRALHPDDLAPTVAVWTNSVTTGEPYDIEHRVRRLTGEYRWIRSRAWPRREAGTIVKWYGVTEDIQERKLAEETLQHSEASLRMATDAAEVGTWDLDPGADKLFCSERTRAVFGIGPVEPITLDDFYWAVHRDDQKATAAAFNGALDPELRATYDVEYRTVGKQDGTVRWVAAKGRGMFDADGRCIRMLGTAIDITQRKETEHRLLASEAELKLINDDLATRVADAVAEREAALGQMHAMQKLETIGQLTGGVAHDFNNLLTPIVGGLDILSRRLGDDPRAARTISGALQSAERARVLVQRLLAFARRQHLEARPVDLAELVGGMDDLIDRSLGPLIEVKVALEPDLPAVMVDPNQLELALLNLAVNARDAMSGQGVLTIAAGAATPDRTADHGLPAGHYVWLSVSDTGIGMPPETLARAVEPFYSTKNVGKGTGLGLSMVHGLAAQSGGQLTLTSAPGEGTTATLWLPVAAMIGRAARADTKDGDAGSSGPRLTVLLVDDEELVRQATAEMLSDMGHRVIQAASGAAALSVIGSGENIDLLLTDHLMPSMTGVELVGQARKSSPGLPALLVTGYAELSDEAAGGLTRLSKPFRQEQLAAALRRAAQGPKVVKLGLAAQAR